MKTAITVLSDLHINSTVGLCRYRVPLDDGGFYSPSKQQEVLLKAWIAFMDFSKRMSKEIGAEQNILVLNGDLVDLSKYSKHQNITTNANSIIDHALNLIEPIRTLNNKLFVLRGTEAHVGNSGEIEEIIARELKAERDEDTGIYSRWNLQLDCNDLLIDFAHHGRIGSKPWNRNSPLYTMATEIMMEGFKNGRDIPDLVIRSHHHTFADTLNALPIRVIQTPCWQLNTAYSHRMGFVNKPDIGGLIILIDESNENRPKYDVEVAAYEIPQIQPVKL